MNKYLEMIFSRRRRLQTLILYFFAICVCMVLLNLFLNRNNVTMTSSAYQRHLVALRKLEPMFNRLKSFKNESDIIYVRKIAIKRRDKLTSLAYIMSEERTLEKVTQHLQTVIKPSWFNYRTEKPGPQQVQYSKSLSIPERFFGIEKVVVPSFRYTLNHASICNVENLHMLVMVTSFVQNQKNRMAIRRSWGRTRKIHDLSIRIVFLIGAGSAYYQTQAEAEDSQFHDMIQQEFVDGFGQRTFKLMMGLDWFRNYCPNANYVLIVSDNVVPNFYKIIPFIRKIDVENDLYLGRVRYKDSPHIVSSDRYLSNVTWNTKNYPPFCERPFWLLSRDVVDKMAAVMPYTAWMYPEDVYLGILAAKLGVKPTDYSKSLIHSLNEDPRRLLADATSPVMMTDIIDDVNLPIVIMQLNHYIESLNRNALGVVKFRGRINPVSTGDVIIDMQ